jgi:hypothetical protein
MQNVIYKNKVTEVKSLLIKDTYNRINNESEIAQNYDFDLKKKNYIREVAIECASNIIFRNLRKFRFN